MPFSEPELRFNRSTILVIVLCLMGLALMAVGVFLGHGGALGIPLICAACVVKVRCYFCRLQRHLDAAHEELNRNWREAFDLGREVGQEETGGGVVRIPSRRD
jgi:hypothetical protein